jgi:hypothetical protein
MAIALVGLLWNGFGAYLYVMTRLGNPDLMAGVPAEMQAYIANPPIWADIGWGLGIWGSFAGSVLMLLRSRLAGPAFLVSLLGAIASFAGQAMAGVLDAPMALFIVAVIVFLWQSCRRSLAAGVLH